MCKKLLSTKAAKAFILLLLGLSLSPSQAASPDFDQDGLLDTLEEKMGTDKALADTDGDGLSDDVEVGTDFNKPLNSDQDATINALDWDDDGDQIPTVLESKKDSDQDGLPDYLDTDSDNDGISDTDEAGLSHLDSDHDGIDDAFDADTTHGEDKNGDGIEDHSALAKAVTKFTKPSKKAEVNSAASTLSSNSQQLNKPELNKVMDVEVSETAALSLVIKPTTLKPETAPLVLVKKPDTDGDHLPDELEIGLDPKHPVDTDGDGIFDFLDEDDDGDQVLTLIEGEADRDGDGRVNYLDVDESGYFYCANTGRIVAGIKNFKISPSKDVVLEKNAESGRYRWHAKKPGTYTLQFILPKNLRTVTELEKGQLYVTSANGKLVNLGWSEDINHEGYLAQFDPKQLPTWYSSFVIQDGAPPMMNQNIPLTGGECEAP